MPPLLCLRCLRHSLRSIEHHTSYNGISRLSFSSTSLLSAKPAPPKKTSTAKPGTRAAKTLRLSKNVRQTSGGKPPEPGERKAMRKRIVLSNTNALEVKDLQDLTGDKLMRHEEGSVTLDKFQGQVLGFNNPTVDALRALESFKPTQSWSLFHRPASLIRKESAALANELVDAERSQKVLRRIVFGEKGSGKSAYILQAHAMAFLKDWIVIHMPEGQDLTIAHTAYDPLRTPEGTVYIQPQYTAKLLRNIATANKTILASMQLSKEPRLPIPIQPNMSLDRLAQLGADDPALAWPIWQALWSELISPSREGKGMHRRPVLFSLDAVDQVMRHSAYLDVDAKPIHAHDLALVRDFTKFLSGQTALPNGGAVLAATCASNRAASSTLDYLLKHAYAQQQLSSANGASSASVSLPTWDPYAAKDARVESALQGVGVLKLEGLSKDEARGIMEYYAQSGILRGAVTDGFVSEKWTLAGSGIVGELERGSVRA